MTKGTETLFSGAHRENLTNYAKAALDWSFVEEDSDLYYQRMFNLAGDVLKLVAEVERLRGVMEDEIEMAEQSVKTLRELHDHWRTIIDEPDDDGDPLIENLLYWLIEDVKPSELRKALDA